MNKEITIQELNHRLTVLEREVAFLHLGAKKVGPSAPVNGEKEAPEEWIDAMLRKEDEDF